MYRRFASMVGRAAPAARKILSKPKVAAVVEGGAGFMAFGATSWALAGTGALAANWSFGGHAPTQPKVEGHRDDLPTMKLEDVQEHFDQEHGVWVTFRGGVYDVTNFAAAHPGGITRLLMAGGGDLEPYWKVYRQHYRGHILEFLEGYRIGNLTPDEANKATHSFVFDDAYETDPVRDPFCLPCTQKPWCGEPRTDLLTKNFYTPNELHYTRNHLPVPDMDPDEYVLVVKGNGVKKHKFTLKDIKEKFKKYEVVSTLQCAGNRREDFHGKRSIFISPHWVIGAISNAKWGGARLRDVLHYCGMDVDEMALGRKDSDNIQHVQFEGYDHDETGLTYGGSIPIDKAVDGLGDCLVAYEMNGQDIPRDHGYPVRALSPGHAGARNCKWLHKIIVSDKESDRPWHQKSYRGFSPDISFEKDLSHWPHGLRLDQAKIVQEMPVQSLVCNPSPNEVIGVKGNKSGTILLKGVSWSGGGRGINRVDVSIDGGKNFTAAELYKPIKQRRNREWAWVPFEKEIQLTDEMKSQLRKGYRVELDICSKAVNGDFNVQPESPDAYYNARGVCINHWYHVPVVLDPYLRDNVEPQRIEFSNYPTGGKFLREWNMHGWTSPQGEEKLQPTK